MAIEHYISLGYTYLLYIEVSLLLLHIASLLIATLNTLLHIIYTNTSLHIDITYHFYITISHFIFIY